MSGALALDLGSSTTRVADERGQLLFEEETLAAIDLASGRLIAFGNEALSLGARSGGRVALERPVRAGKLVDVDLAESVIAALFERVGVSRLERPEVAVCAHVDMSDVQRRTLERALHRSGARRIRFVEQPVAVAIGAGLEIAEPTGSMVIDVGGGMSDVGLMALGGLVAAVALPLGVNDLDEALRRHFAWTHDLNVDRRAISALRTQVGSLAPLRPTDTIEVRGRDTHSGLPSSAILAQSEIAATLVRAVEPVFDAAVRCVTDVPPDLANDLLAAGLVLAGGGSGLDALDRRLAAVTGVPVHVPSEPTRLAVRGAARCLDGELAGALSATMSD